MKQDILRMGQLDMVQFLVEEGADVNTENHDGLTALSYAHDQNHHMVADYLISNGA